MEELSDVDLSDTSFSGIEITGKIFEDDFLSTSMIPITIPTIHREPDKPIGDSQLLIISSTFSPVRFRLILLPFSI